jgi:hypothetical protein
VRFLLFFSLFLFWQCKEQPIEIPDLKVGKRRVLVEELSGVNCNNCPDAAKEIEKIRASVGAENVVAVTIYPGMYGVLSRPLPNSRFDFRMPSSDALVNFLGVADAIPALSVNRTIVNAGETNPFLLNKNQWGGVVRSELQKDPLVGIFLETTWNAASRELGITADITPERTLTDDYLLTVMITQDSVVDAQNDKNNILDNYAHRHVLRRILTLPGGDRLEPLTLGTLVSKSFSSRLPVDWDVTKCSVVAFVHGSGTPNLNVLQAVEKKVQK